MFHLLAGGVLANVSGLSLIVLGNWGLGVLIGLVVVGLLALTMTSYRYVTGYFIAGMLYWLVIEVLQHGLSFFMPLSQTHAYIIAMGISLVPVWALLDYQPKHHSRKHAKPAPTTTELTHPISRLGAGQRPIILEKDTSFYQHYICHSPLLKSDR